MRKVTEVLRLKYVLGLSQRDAAASCGISQSVVHDYLRRAAAAGISWPLPEGLTEAAIEQRLFPGTVTPERRLSAKALPDFAYVHEELRSHRRLNLTLDLLWREYKEQHPHGYQYTQFCEHYRRWRLKLDLPMRQSHKAGEKVFVDYADGLALTNPATGERVATQLFIAVWGASNYTFVEASLSQDLAHWTASHVRAFQFFGCVPQVVVPDNLKSAVTDACRYEPELNPTYAELAAHYGVAVIPARPRHPRDKAKVETGVLIVKRWILSALRHQTFFTLAELNAAIRQLLDKLNDRPLRKIGKSRRMLFEAFDRPAAKALPEAPYQFAQWKRATVNIDYHAELDKHYYSVPCQFIHQAVDIRYSDTTVEIFARGERVAAHARSYVPYKHTTCKDHMPPAHRQHADWSPSRILSWAGTIGPNTVRFVQALIDSRAFPEQSYRAALGVLRLAKHYPKDRIEAAAQRAVRFRALSFRAFRGILAKGLDRLPLDNTRSSVVTPDHGNIRGPHYYN
jgi:transposase